MIYKVEIASPNMMGMVITHVFEAVVDTKDEAEEFGEKAFELFSGWSDGYVKGAEND